MARFPPPPPHRWLGGNLPPHKKSQKENSQGLPIRACWDRQFEELRNCQRCFSKLCTESRRNQPENKITNNSGGGGGVGLFGTTRDPDVFEVTFSCLKSYREARHRAVVDPR